MGSPGSVHRATGPPENCRMVLRSCFSAENNREFKILCGEVLGNGKPKKQPDKTDFRFWILFQSSLLSGKKTRPEEEQVFETFASTPQLISNPAPLPCPDVFHSNMSRVWSLFVASCVSETIAARALQPFPRAKTSSRVQVQGLNAASASSCSHKRACLDERLHLQNKE